MKHRTQYKTEAGLLVSASRNAPNYNTRTYAIKRAIIQGASNLIEVDTELGREVNITNMLAARM